MDGRAEEVANTPDVVIPVTQKLSKNVNGHHSKTSISLDFQNRKNGLVEN